MPDARARAEGSRSASLSTASLPHGFRSAIVHDWIVDLGGAEKCLASLYDMFPSDVFTVVHDDRSVTRLGIPPDRVTDSFVARLPRARRSYRSYLPLLPSAVEAFDLSAYDVVISSSHAVAKGVLTHAGQLHVCYCYTPMRYAWDLCHQYLRETGLDRGLKGLAARAALHYLRLWDLSTVNRVDHFVAISSYIARRIARVYGRESTVIYPPVDVDRLAVGRERDDFYLAASRFVPYKRIDLIVEAFSAMPDRRLVVIGDGPDAAKIAAKAASNVQLLGYQPDDVLHDHLQRARAFVFAAEEDFGIVPVEAQACGTPVIAFGRGGARETVAEGVSGVFFEEQTVRSLIDAVHRFESGPPLAPPDGIRQQAMRFSRQRFEHELRDFVLEKHAAFAERR